MKFNFLNLRVNLYVMLMFVCGLFVIIKYAFLSQVFRVASIFNKKYAEIATNYEILALHPTFYY